MAGLVTLTGCASPARPGAFFGLDVPGASITTLDAVSTMLGRRPTVFSLFVKLDTSALAARLDALHAAGQTPFVTLEPWPVAARPGQVDQPRYSLASIVAGDHDPALLALAHQMATFRGLIYLRFAHEMNEWWYPWAASVNGNTPSGYVAAWRHVHDLFARVPGLDLRWVWAPGTVAGPRATADLGALYPGDGYVDDVGVSGYEHRSASPASTYDPLIARLRALTHRPVILSEIGVDGPDKTRWLTNLGPWVRRRPDVAGFVYFDTSPATTGATGDYRFTVARADLVAFRSTLRHLGGRASAARP